MAADPNIAMALNKAESHSPATWFLIAHGGELISPLSDEVTLGEDKSGELIVNPAVERGIVSISATSASLTIRCLVDGAALVDTDGSRRQEIRIDPGPTTALLLSTNLITLTGDPIPTGRVTQRIRLELSSRRRPIRAPRRQLPRVDGGVAPDGGRIQASPKRHDNVASIPTQRGASVLPATDLDPTDLHSPTTTLGGRTLPMVLFCLLLVGVVAEDSHVVEPVSTLNPRDAPTPVATGRGLKLLASSVSRVRSDDIVTPALLTHTRETGQSTTFPDRSADTGPSAPQAVSAQESPPVELQSRSAQQSQIREARLQEARQLLEAGVIIEPGRRNAVKLLEQILQADPANDEALQLIFECASRLLLQAQSAYAAGKEFEARNLIEEVRAFHPTHEQANSFWARIVSEPPAPD